MYGISIEIKTFYPALKAPSLKPFLFTKPPEWCVPKSSSFQLLFPQVFERSRRSVADKVPFCLAEHDSHVIMKLPLIEARFEPLHQHIHSVR